jgi:cytochrome c biogenesis protein CcmG/thiol:disulfide interchange protein DsbE
VIVAAVPGSLLIRRALTDETRREPLRSGPAPAFSLVTTDGTTVSSSDLAGRPSVVHFFASWCKPCRDEIAVLDTTRRRHPDLTVVGVVIRDNPADAGRAARDLGLSWPLLVDPDEQAARAFGVDSAPVTFFVSAEGRITGRLIGPVSTLLVDRQLERIL